MKMKNEHLVYAFTVFVFGSLLYAWYYVSGATSVLGAFEIGLTTKPLTAVMASTFIVAMFFIGVGLSLNKR